MGRLTNSEKEAAFCRRLLDDLHGLSQLLDQGGIESGVRRIGAEQEMFLVDEHLHPAPCNDRILEEADDPRLTPELARFNLEANLTPQTFGGSCLRRVHEELDALVSQVRTIAARHGVDVMLTGILPTIRRADLGIDNMTPAERYFELNRNMVAHRGGRFHVAIRGLDELEVDHSNVMLESCNTSFQLHFQVGPREFAPLYNIAQAITAPVLAAAVNSPVLLARRLWHETRIALFQGAVDSRTQARMHRGAPPRVHFGNSWVNESVLEVFREDITRFEIMLAREFDGVSSSNASSDGPPTLDALRLFNGTVYRWNRPCYGVHGGQAHLRIENRVLPAGPTTLDEIANSALYFGLLSGMSRAFPPIDKLMRFDDAKRNFFAAARDGLQAQFVWLDGKTRRASEILLDELIPLAREGLEHAEIDTDDIDLYLGVIEERVASQQTGARWVLDSLAQFDGERSLDRRMYKVSKAMLDHQQLGRPVHTWAVASPSAGPSFTREGFAEVRQLMSTDLFTVRPTDIVDLVATVMDWRHLRHVPVEDHHGHLVGLISHRSLLRLVAQGRIAAQSEPITAESIMTRDPICVRPAAPPLEAIDLMQRHRVSCLPVVEDHKLVGIVTERDFIGVTASLLRECLARP